jgi:hypothetical protein
MWNAGLRGRASVVIASPLTVGVAAAVVAPLVRDRFVATGAGGREVFRMSPVAGLGELTVGLSFPP